ncbi:hypothetical protein KY338_02270 [Candidatus Woesearchaeota archaeon]|nr:hypothetical protein [Candidatus Woesearchaeota archaeon]MBW3006117.1 hypothetical protein [Candidatus Woesearchaeota archaeon]
MAKCKTMSSQTIIVMMLGILVIVAIVGLVMTMKSEGTGKAVYSAPRLCPMGMTSHAGDSPLLKAKQDAGYKCTKAAYPGWYCCESSLQ